jgi:hypothetical protein
VGGGGGWSERMGDAKSRQRMRDGSHGNGRVNIEIAPVLGSGTKSKEDDMNGDVYFHHVSYFLTTAILPKITFHTENLCIGSW